VQRIGNFVFADRLMEGRRREQQRIAVHQPHVADGCVQRRLGAQRPGQDVSGDLFRRED
jgi:hypothetical protein